MSFDPVSARRASIRHLRPYYKAPDGPMLRLDQNTNLLGPNPAVARLRAQAEDLSLYPSRDADRLREAIGRSHDLPREAVSCTNGSDEALDLILKAYTEPGDTLAIPDPSYSLYPFYAALHGLRLARVPMTGDWSPDVPALLGTDAKVLLVASPNNPTGRAVAPHDLDRLVREAQGLVVVDEAYAEYHDGKKMLPLVAEHRNLVVIRTFSKAYALAGVRLGWIAAHPDTMEAMRLVKPPFNVGLLTERLGVLALEEEGFVTQCVSMVRKERERLRRGLVRFGFEVVPGDANFLLAFPGADLPDGPWLLGALRERGVAARAFPDHPRLARAIRFTVGGPEHTKALLDVLGGILADRGEAKAPSDDGGGRA